MLPLRLTVENFMPYRGRHEPLELSGLGVACLAGPNGAGKSALLDAITWAVWGHSRTRSVDSLVAAGMSEMAVELEFRVGESVYRVLRRYRRAGARTRAAQASLEFQTWDGAGWRALTEPTARATEQRIVDTIHLTYDTFIHTAFLVQGRADMFVSQPPADRKRLLGEILGLSRYDGFVQRARDEARRHEARRDSARMTGDRLDGELAGAQDVRDQLASVGTALTASRARAAIAREERDRLTDDAARLERLATEVTALREQGATMSDNVARLTTRADELAARIRDHEVVQSRRTAIDDGFAALTATIVELAEHGDRARRHTPLVEERAHWQRVIAEARTTLEQDVARLDTQLHTATEEAGRLPDIERERQAAVERRDTLNAERESLQPRRARLAELNGGIESRLAQWNRLREESGQLQQRLTVLDDGTPDEQCPVCETPLGHHGIERVREHYHERQIRIATESEQITKEGVSLRQEHDDLQRAVDLEDERIRAAIAAADDAGGRLTGDADRARAAVERAAATRQDLDAAQGRLTALTDGEPTQKLRDVDARIAELRYDYTRHQAVSDLVPPLEHWEGDYRTLQRVNDALPQDQVSLSETAQDLVRLRDSHDQLASRLAEIDGELVTRPDVVARATEARRVVDELEQQVDRAAREETRLAVRLEHLEGQRAERRRVRVEERLAADEKAIHDELAAAFGARGVQALLIETALPELEDEANKLLAGMTDNRMHLRLETQRENRTGGQRETLDLIIGDEWGTRPYELYSGGEGFRINFALRIALSRLLARRAGAEAPVLFIDEGFGSQDEDGRDRLVEAIDTLWNDPAFRGGLILVITHIEEIKNRFDTRIEVIKTDRGSQFSIAS